MTVYNILVYSERAVGESAVLSGSKQSKSSLNLVRRGSSVGIATRLQARRSGDQIPVEATFSVTVQTGHGTHSAFYTMGTWSLSRG